MTMAREALRRVVLSMPEYGAEAVLPISQFADAIVKFVSLQI
jgi:hypothetical protein